jgi:hypothetical protein
MHPCPRMVIYLKRVLNFGRAASLVVVTNWAALAVSFRLDISLAAPVGCQCPQN